MKYLIDSADLKEIEEAAALGVWGITANPTMYAKNNQSFYPFLRICSAFGLPFLSGEVMSEHTEEMLRDAQRILTINPDIVIKLPCCPEGLKTCRLLKHQGAKCAVTLIFTLSQGVAAINAGADFVFPFVGRTDEYGGDGMALAVSLQNMAAAKSYPVKVVAASIKNLHQLESLAVHGLDFAAIPYALLNASLSHPLTDRGLKTFQEDWRRVETE